MQINDEHELQAALTEIQQLTARRHEPEVGERLLALEAAAAAYTERLNATDLRAGRPGVGKQAG